MKAGEERKPLVRLFAPRERHIQFMPTDMLCKRKLCLENRHAAVAEHELLQRLRKPFAQLIVEDKFWNGALKRSGSEQLPPVEIPASRMRPS